MMLEQAIRPARMAHQRTHEHGAQVRHDALAMLWKVWLHLLQIKGDCYWELLMVLGVKYNRRNQTPYHIAGHFLTKTA